MTIDNLPPSPKVDQPGAETAKPLRGAAQRSWRNFLLVPKSQFRTASVIFLVGFLFISVLFAALLWRLGELIQTLASLSVDPEQASMVASNSLEILIVMYAVLIISFLLTSVFLGIYITHRYLGPMVPIQRHVKALLAGNHDSRIKLRKGDEFQSLATDLNALGEVIGRNVKS